MISMSLDCMHAWRTMSVYQRVGSPWRKVGKILPSYSNWPCDRPAASRPVPAGDVGDACLGERKSTLKNLERCFSGAEINPRTMVSSVRSLEKVCRQGLRVQTSVLIQSLPLYYCLFCSQRGRRLHLAPPSCPMYHHPRTRAA